MDDIVAGAPAPRIVKVAKMHSESIREQDRALARDRTGFNDDSHFPGDIQTGRQLHAVAAVDQDVLGNVVHIGGIDVQQGDAPVAEPARAFEFHARGAGAAQQPAAADAGGSRPHRLVSGRLGAENSIGKVPQVGMSRFIQRMRGYRMHGTAPPWIGGDEHRGTGRHISRPRGSRTGMRAHRQRLRIPECSPREMQVWRYAAANHVRGEYRAMAGPSGNDVLRTSLQGGDDGVNTHLTHHLVLTQRLLGQHHALPQRVQRPPAEFSHDLFHRQLGADGRHRGVANAELGKNVAGDRRRGGDIPIAPPISSAAQNERAAEPMRGRDHFLQVRPDVLCHGIGPARTQIEGPGVRSPVAGYCIDPPLESGLERLPRKTASEPAGGGDNAVN